jgi:hypothetical protein
MPDGWTMEASKEYQLLTTVLCGEPEQRWYRVLPAEVSP